MVALGESIHHMPPPASTIALSLVAGCLKQTNRIRHLLTLRVLVNE